jgi:hypothetical protein
MGINNFKYRHFIIVIIICIGLNACSTSETEEGLYCINCNAEEPDSEQISIKITINNENPSVPVAIYKDKFNPSKNLDTVFSDTISSSFSLKVATNKYYSVKATYRSGNKTIYAIDGSWFDTQKLTGCQNTCWKTLGGSYDLRLEE